MVRGEAAVVAFSHGFSVVGSELALTWERDSRYMNVPSEQLLASNKLLFARF
jgi:hypothetical protein